MITKYNICKKNPHKYGRTKIRKDKLYSTINGCVSVNAENLEHGPVHSLILRIQDRFSVHNGESL